jgi:hypothetical protein
MNQDRRSFTMSTPDGFTPTEGELETLCSTFEEATAPAVFHTDGQDRTPEIATAVFQHEPLKLSDHMVTAKVDNLIVSSGVQYPTSFVFAMRPVPKEGVELRVANEPPVELLRFSNQAGKLVITGDLTRGGAALAAHLHRTLGFPLPERPIHGDPNLMVLVAKFTVDGMFYILPVADVEKQGGLSELYEMAGAGAFSIELFFMSVSEINRMGEFDGF